MFDSIGKQIYLPDTCPCSVLKLYQEPLTAALNSNRAILGYADIQIILSPVTQILELNRYAHTHIHTNISVVYGLVCAHVWDRGVRVCLFQSVSGRHSGTVAAVGCGSVYRRCVCETMLKSQSLHQLSQQLHHCPLHH